MLFIFWQGCKRKLENKPKIKPILMIFFMFQFWINIYNPYSFEKVNLDFKLSLL